jgi:hypothetical protein
MGKISTEPRHFPASSDQYTVSPHLQSYLNSRHVNANQLQSIYMRSDRCHVCKQNKLESESSPVVRQSRQHVLFEAHPDQLVPCALMVKLEIVAADRE